MDPIWVQKMSQHTPWEWYGDSSGGKAVCEYLRAKVSQHIGTNENEKKMYFGRALDNVFILCS